MFPRQFVKRAVAEAKLHTELDLPEEIMLEVLEKFGDREFFANEFLNVEYSEDDDYMGLDTLVRDEVFESLVKAGWLI